MSNTGRIFGIDAGEKRFGLAKTDPLGIIASPVGTFNETDLIKALSRHVQEESVRLFVVGWPLSLDGTENKATEMVDRFISRLQKKIPDIPVFKLDERFTSTMAQQVIIASGIPMMKRREKGLADSIAASILLQSYLEKFK